MTKASDPLRVVKKLTPTQPGAIKLARRYGEALLCVRYRHDGNSMQRFTTVELIVDQAPLQPHANRLVEVAAEQLRDVSLRALAMSKGAVWVAQRKVWRMRYGVAGQLGLQVAGQPK